MSNARSRSFGYERTKWEGAEVSAIVASSRKQNDQLSRIAFSKRAYLFSQKCNAFLSVLWLWCPSWTNLPTGMGITQGRRLETIQKIKCSQLMFIGGWTLWNNLVSTMEGHQSWDSEVHVWTNLSILKSLMPSGERSFHGLRSGLDTTYSVGCA